MTVDPLDCPRASQRNHSPLRGEPLGYVAWHEWAESKSKTHEQEKCPDCDRYAIWKPKRPSRVTVSLPSGNDGKP